MMECKRWEERHGEPFGREVRFSYVRDPLERFISGYSEIEYRKKLHMRRVRGGNLNLGNGKTQSGGRNGIQDYSVVDQVGGANYTELMSSPVYQKLTKMSTFPTYIAYRDGTATRAYAFLQDYAVGRFLDPTDRLREEYHCFLQYAFIYPYNLSYIGKTNHIFRDINRMNVIKIKAEDVKDTHFGSNRDSHNTDREVMTKLLQEQPGIQCALVRMLLLDYICFGFPIPSQCLREDPNFRDIVRTLTCPHNLLVKEEYRF